MKKIVRLNENDLVKLIKKVLSESDGDGQQDSFTEYEYRDDIYADSTDSEIEKKDDIDSMTQQVAEDWYRRKMNRRRLNENINNVLEIKRCYTNSGKPFPTSCEKGSHKDCKEKIRSTATSFFQGNKNAQNDPKISKFWGCINKVDPSILAGMG